ncbi:hypothetical protein [Polymorphobacter multimanifer]|uniref:hypothetical protein n=1 Tax=Polymorphobacter multimanifer TaxID=1070431 RepID=UPI001667BFE4|nr:hypothetical protein [Polymorphobacter multimanifer]
MIEQSGPRAMGVGLLLAGVSACGGGDEKTGTADVATPVAAPAADGAPEPAAGGSASLWNGGAVGPLDVQVAHPSGVVLQLFFNDTATTETAIGMRVINGRERDVQLNRFNTNRNGYLVLDGGERLYLSPPVNNARLVIEPGQTMEGELVFLGRLSPVGNATLVLNENQSMSNEHTTTPGFRIDLPLAAGAAQ